MARKRKSIARALLLAALMAGSVFTSSTWAQYNYEDTAYAYVPFIVNVNATVRATVPCPAVVGAVCDVDEYVYGGEETILRLPFRYPVGVRFFGVNGYTNLPVIVNSNGKITVNLPTQYKNAKVMLYAVNGKRILCNSVNLANAENMAIRRSIASGVYLLSVKWDGGVITSRLTHRGGGFDINVAFGREHIASRTNLQSKKSAQSKDWMVRVWAVGDGYGVYADSTYWITVTPGLNPVQNITMRRIGEEK